MNKAHVSIRYAVFDYNCGHPVFKKDQDSEMIFNHESNGTSITKPVKSEPKGIQGLLMNTCFAVNPNGSEGPPVFNCEIFVSEDKTKIKFIGEKRTRADSLYFGSSVGASNDPANKIVPQIDKSSNRKMFQVADVFAYCAAHALSTEYEGTFFKEQLSLIKYWSSATFVPPLTNA